MPVLYLTEQGAVLKQEGQRLIVVREGQKIADLPLLKLESVLIYGHLQITTQAMRILLKSGIETAFMTLNGRLIGHLMPVKSKNAPLRMRQYQRVRQPEWSLARAKEIVIAKLNNCNRVLEHYINNHSDAAIQSIRKLLKKWPEKVIRKQTPQNLLGVEGSGTQCYYDGYRKTFRKQLKFNGRNRRPPQDPVNALLSFGYTLLGNEIMALCNARGLDPYLGFYHGIQYGRPSLAMDLVEPFRPAIDLFTMNLANRAILQAKDFEYRDGGVYLTKKGLKTYFTQYEKWARASSPGRPSIRQQIKHEVQSLIDSIHGETARQPFRLS